MKIVSQACYVGTQAWLVRLSYSFLIQIFLQLVVVENEYIKLGVRKIRSRAHFDIVVRTQAWILRPLYSFLS